MENEVKITNEVSTSGRFAIGLWLFFIMWELGDLTDAVIRVAEALEATTP